MTFFFFFFADNDLSNRTNCPKESRYSLSLLFSKKKKLSLSLSLSRLKNSKTHTSQSLIFPTISFLSRENSHMGTLKYSPNQMGLL